jgi:endoplasmic reticulum-Golgi intermediate compartment protein 3
VYPAGGVSLVNDDDIDTGRARVRTGCAQVVLRVNGDRRVTTALATRVDVAQNIRTRRGVTSSTQTRLMTVSRTPAVRDACGVRGERAREMLRSIRRFDAYASVAPHLTTKTRTGAYISLIGIACVACMALFECVDFLTPTMTKTMSVDTVPWSELLSIEIDVTFPEVPCQILYVDMYDASGKHEVDVRGRLVKTRLNHNGKMIDDYESAGGVDLGGVVLFQRRPEHGSEVRRAKMAKEGCRIHGEVLAQRVAGSIRISTGAEGFGFMQELFGNAWEVNMGHEIKRLAFGKGFPGAVNPLDGVKRSQTPSGIFKYFMKVVPTTYTDLRALFGFIPWKTVLKTNQYSVTEHFTPSKDWLHVPEVFFTFDLSAITVNIAVEAKSLVYFLTKTISTLGGVFAMTRMVDRYVDVALRVGSRHTVDK